MRLGAKHPAAQARTDGATHHRLALQDSKAIAFVCASVLRGRIRAPVVLRRSERSSAKTLRRMPLWSDAWLRAMRSIASRRRRRSALRAASL